MPSNPAFCASGNRGGERGERVHRNLACDIAGIVPAHAIGHDVQRRAHDKGVLIALALATDIGARAEMYVRSMRCRH